MFKDLSVPKSIMVIALIVGATVAVTLFVSCGKSRSPLVKHYMSVGNWQCANCFECRYYTDGRPEGCPADCKSCNHRVNRDYCKAEAKELDKNKTQISSEDKVSERIRLKLESLEGQLKDKSMAECKAFLQ